MSIYKAYRDECLLIGLCSLGSELFDGYLDIFPEERKAYELVDKEFWKWQELLRKRYKKA